MSDADLAFAGAAAPGRARPRRARSRSRELVELYLDRIARHDPRAQRLPRRPRRAGARGGRRGRRPPRRTATGGRSTASRSRSRTTWTSRARSPPRARSPTAAAPAAARREGRPAACARPGAVVLGKTNVPELMTMPFTETLWYGATRNPWDLDRTPGGSSGGSGAAVAAGPVRRRHRRPTAPARSASRPPAAASSASSRRRASCPTPAGLARPVDLRLPHAARWRDAALLLRRRQDGGESYVEAVAGRAGRLRVALVDQGRRSASARAVDATHARRRRRRSSRRVARPRPRGRRARPGHRPGRAPTSSRATCAGSPRTRPVDAAPRAAGPPHASGWRGSAALIPDARGRPRRRGRRRRRPRAPRRGLRATSTSSSLPLFTELPLRIGAYEGLGGGALAGQGARLRPVPRAVQPHRAAGARGARRGDAGRLPARRPARRARRAQRRGCSRSPPSSSGPSAGRTGGPPGFE